FDIRRENENAFVAYRPRVRFRIVDNPFEFDVAHVRPLERHGEFRLVAHWMANCAELGPAVEIDRLNNERVTFPMPARISEPGRRPILSVWHAFGVDGLEHRALFKEKGDVLVVLYDLHGMRRERSYPTERHAASGVVTLSDLIIIVPLRLAPSRKRKRILLSFIAGSVRVRERASHVLSAGTIPHSAEIGFAVRKPWGGRLQVRFQFQCLAS